MSVTITTDVFCDYCNDWCDGASDGLRIRIKAARAQAKAKGWKRVRDGSNFIDLCPKCYPKWLTGIEPDEPDEIEPMQMDERHVQMMAAFGFKISQ